jgi:RND superfamily putative drug exporter
VLLDATIVRLVLLPALIKLCGEASWWLPGWLDRLLPHMEVEPEDEPSTTPSVIMEPWSPSTPSSSLSSR